MTSPAPNWPTYEPGIVGIAPVPTLAEIAYKGNMRFDDFIQPVQPISKVSKRNFYSKLTCSSLNDNFIEGWTLHCLGRTPRFSLRSLTASEKYSLGAGMAEAQSCMAGVWPVLVPGFLGSPRCLKFFPLIICDHVTPTSTHTPRVLHVAAIVSH